MNKENFKIYSGERCEKYYKKYNLVSSIHRIIDLEDILEEVKNFCLEFEFYDVLDYINKIGG